MLQFAGIRFRDEIHRDFFLSMTNMLGSRGSVYHAAYFYLLGLCDTTRLHYADLYDFDAHQIKLDGLYGGWQTGSTTRLTLLAFNLWNGWAEDGQEIKSTPYYLFDCDLAPYFFEAIKLRYPEFCRN